MDKRRKDSTGRQKRAAAKKVIIPEITPEEWAGINPRARGKRGQAHIATHRGSVDITRDLVEHAFAGEDPYSLPLSEVRRRAEMRLLNERLDAAFSAQNGPTETKTEKGKIESEGVLPRTWEELRKRNSITQREAAAYLQRNPKTVRRLVKDKKLGQSAKKRIICDEHLRNQIRKVHGPRVLP